MKPIISMCAIAAMTCSVAAWADKPVEYPISYSAYANPLFECGDFQILFDTRVEGYERHYFNNDGSLNRILYHVAFRDTVYYNSNDPTYWLPGTAEHQQQWLYFENGVPVLYSPAGPIVRVILPGYGPVALWTGTWVYDITLGELVFNSHPRNFTFESDAFCAALRP
ncbi:MAG: hypothetical protein ACK2UO_12235 [Caldilineaceae bacterium]